AAFGAGGFSLGLVLSGLLTEVSWRWTLLLPAPVSAVILVAAARVVPRATAPDRRGRRFALPGAATVPAAMLLLVYAVVNAPQAGWASARTLGSFAAVALLLAAFVTIERRSRDPLVRLGIFRSATLTRANLGLMVLFGSYVAFQFLVTQYLQIMAGWAALATPPAVLPPGVRVALAPAPMGAGPGQVRATEDDRGGLRLPGGRLRAVPPHRPAPGLPGGDPALGAADRRRVRARVLVAEHPGHRGRGQPGAGPRVGHPADLVPGRRGDRPPGRPRDRRRGRRQPRRNDPGADRLPSRIGGHHRHRRARRADRAQRPVAAADAERRRSDRGGLWRGRARVGRPRPGGLTAYQSNPATIT